MEKKYKFVKKSSPQIKTNKKLHPHYSKIINSIFNETKEKDKRNKETMHINKEKFGKGFPKSNNKNYNKKLILNNNRLKDLFLYSSSSTINYYTNGNINNNKIKKNLKFDNLINIKNGIKKRNVIKRNNNSEKNSKIKKNFDYSTSINNSINNNLEKDIKIKLDNNNINNKKEKELKKTLDNNIKNIKNIYSKFNQINNIKPHNIKVFKKTKNNNNFRKLIPIQNNSHNVSYNYEHNSNSPINNNKKNKLKKFYISSGFTNSELFIKKNSENKRSFKRNNEDSDVTKTPLTNFKRKNKYVININLNNSNNTSLTAYHNKNMNLVNKNIKNYKNNIFSQNKMIENDKASVINIKDKIKKLDLSDLSLTNSCSTIVIDSKKLRSLSKKRDEKKIINMKQNELFSERANKKIYNLYLYINEQKNNPITKTNPNIKLIDRIRKNKKLKFNNLYMKTE